MNILFVIFGFVLSVSAVNINTEDIYNAEDVFDEHGAIILMIEPETGQIIDANYAATEFYGYSFEELIKMKITEINILTKEETAIEMKRAVEQERNFFIFGHQLKDKSIRTVEVYSSPIKTVNDKVILFSIIHDITERVNNEKYALLQRQIIFGLTLLLVVLLIGNSLYLYRAKKKEIEKQEQIKYLSCHDQLTEVYNRHFFETELKRLNTNRNLPLSIAMLDVNGLKLTNDAFGHITGDKLLQFIAKKMKDIFRVDDIIARIGGDEFVVILPTTSMIDTKQIIKRLQSAIKDNFFKNIVVSISVGIYTKTSDEERIEDILSKAEGEMYHKKIVESNNMRKATIKAILKSFAETNKEEKLHSINVSKIAVKIAEILNYNINMKEEIATAGLLHDIGKVDLQREYLMKPGKLVEEEYNEIKRHTEIGYHILKGVDDYSKYANYALSHHENFDMTGYPRGISQEELPETIRIITLADAVESMVSKRSYRETMSLDEMIKEIERCSGSQFDADIVNACTRYGWGKLLEEAFSN